MTDEDMRRYFRWVDRLTYEAMVVVVMLWALAMLIVLGWKWWRC